MREFVILVMIALGAVVILSVRIFRPPVDNTHLAADLQEIISVKLAVLTIIAGVAGLA